MGGVLFVYNLSKSSQHLEVMEAALFTLGGLAENNGVCVCVCVCVYAHTFDMCSVQS